MPRLIAIGDIHGMSDALRQLLFRVDPQSNDTIITLGDYIDRGPDSKGVIDQLIELATLCTTRHILGNHEEMTLAATTGRNDFFYWLKHGGDHTLKSYDLPAPLRPSSAFDIRTLPDSHVRFFGSLMDFHETDRFLFVHAGCDQDKPLLGQGGQVLRWNSAQDGHKHMSGKVVVCGHSPRPYAQRTGQLWRVDTGAGVRPTGKLSAVDVLSGKVWSVPAGLPPY